MKPRLKLIHNGLILVSVPLAFGLVLVLALNMALQNAMQMRKNMERSAIASAALSRLVNDLVDARGDVIAAQYLKDPNSSARLMQASSRGRGDINHLRELVMKHELYHQRLAEAIPIAERALDALMSSPESTTTGGNVKLESGKMQVDIDASIHKLQYMAQEQTEQLPVDSVSVKRYDESIQHFLAWILAINIAACPLLVLYFSQNVVRRLYVLVSNAERFAKDQELLPPVQGDDEIAQLDKVFREMAQTLTKTRQEREEVERLKQDFIAMISHDLRTPLNAVQGTLTLIADGVYGPISESGVNKAKVAEESIGRLTNLANELLDIERLESKKLPIDLQAVRLQQAIKRSIDSIHGFAIYKQITIREVNTEAVVWADEERLIQVIVNLLSNAIKFSDDGGTVNVSVKEFGSDEIELRVTDQGRGIPSDQKDAIFDRFRQIERADSSNERGMGLGLAICKAIIIGHDGTIGVDSEKGKGCSFWFRLKTTNRQSSLPSMSMELQ